MDGPRLSRLTAVLTRGPGQPAGDTGCGIEIELCLNDRGQIDPACAGDEPWRVRRFWPNRKDWRGQLVLVDDGWAIRGIDGDDEPVWNLQNHILRPGEYLTLVSPDNVELVFRIVNVETVS
jgi:hypothetical protein